MKSVLELVDHVGTLVRIMGMIAARWSSSLVVQAGNLGMVDLAELRNGIEER